MMSLETMKCEQCTHGHTKGQTDMKVKIVISIEKLLNTLDNSMGITLLLLFGQFLIPFQGF